MNIAIFCDFVIPPKNYGGTERVVWYLGKELSEMGHNITYITKKSTVSSFAKVIEYNPSRPMVEQIPEDIDIVHFHGIPDLNINKPYIVTIHGNNYGVEHDRNTVFVSRNHAQRHNSDSYVLNGLDWNDYHTPNLNRERKYYHFLGKASWKVKNIRGAIDIIDQTQKERLYVMGGTRINLKGGFRFSTSLNVNFKNMVGGEKKIRLMEQSKGLLFPVKWHEPFGLAIVESLFVGCPVFATPFGSLPELVTPEVGFLSSNLSDLAQALESPNSFSPQVCHDYALEYFNSKRMALEYLKKYEIVLNGGFLHENPVKMVVDRYDGVSIH